jgi:hypothetical protein
MKDGMHCALIKLFTGEPSIEAVAGELVDQWLNMFHGGAIQHHYHL